MLHLFFQHIKESRKSFDLRLFQSFSQRQRKISVPPGLIFKRALPILTGTQNPWRQYAVFIIQSHQFDTLAGSCLENIFRPRTDIVAAAVQNEKAVDSRITAVLTETADHGKRNGVATAVDIKGLGRCFGTKQIVIVGCFMTVSGKVKDKHVSRLQRGTDL